MSETVSSDSLAQDQLIAFVRRIESFDDELKAINDDKSEVYREAKGNGFEVKVLRKIIADRRKDASERAEFEAIYGLYWDAIHAPAHAHVETIEEIDPETGEVTSAADETRGESPREPGVDEAAQPFPQSPADKPDDSLNVGVSSPPEGDGRDAVPQQIPSPPEHTSPGQNLVAEREGDTSSETVPEPLADRPSDPQWSAGATREDAHLAAPDPIPSALVPLVPLAFVVRSEPIRPYCLHQGDLKRCGGQGKNHCYSCRRLAWLDGKEAA